MKNDKPTSRSEQISQSLLTGALPVAAVTSATKPATGTSSGAATIRVSSLESMTVANTSTDSGGLKLQSTKAPLEDLAAAGKGAKVLAWKKQDA